MKRKAIKIDHDELRTVLLPMLSGRVFHVAGRRAFEHILEDESLKPQQDLSLGYGAARSFFRKWDCICVCDLRFLTEDQLNTALQKFYFLNPQHTKDRPIFFVLNPALHKRLIPWTQWDDKEAYSDLVVPHLEAGYPGEIELSQIDEIIEVEVKSMQRSNAPARILVDRRKNTLSRSPHTDKAVPPGRTTGEQ